MRVRGIDVTSQRRRSITSEGSRAARRMQIPARADTPESGGTVTSIGSQGEWSSPCSHAAVRPEKADQRGRRRAAAASNTSGLLPVPAQT